jgi:hypothetical protein
LRQQFKQVSLTERYEEHLRVSPSFISPSDPGLPLQVYLEGKKVNETKNARKTDNRSERKFLSQKSRFQVKAK